MTSLTVLLEVVSLRWKPVMCPTSDQGAEKLSEKRSNVYGNHYFWQRKLRFRNRDRHRAALFLKSFDLEYDRKFDRTFDRKLDRKFDRTLNRLESKLTPKLGQGYPNLFEHLRNLNLDFFWIQRNFHRKFPILIKKFFSRFFSESGPVIHGIVSMHWLSLMMFKSKW